MNSEKPIVRYQVQGARRWSNYIWGSILLLGGFGFLITGISSFLKNPVLPFINIGSIQFFPQGLIMCFYGALGCLLGLYIWLIIFWNLGEGFNEFNLENGKIVIFRWGFPGKNRYINFEYPIQEVQSIRLEINEGLNPNRTIYLKLSGNREIPLTRVGQPISIQEIENQAAELAKILQVSLEGI